MPELVFFSGTTCWVPPLDTSVVGDVGEPVGEVGYEVLCRRHHRRRLTAATAQAGALSPDVLPF